VARLSPEFCRLWIDLSEIRGCPKSVRAVADHVAPLGPSPGLTALEIAMAFRSDSEASGSSPSSNGLYEDTVIDTELSFDQVDAEDQLKSPHRSHRDSIDYFSLDERLPLGGHNSFWRKFRVLLRPQLTRPRIHDKRIGLRRNGRRRWSDYRFRRRPRLSKLIIYLILGYIFLLFVPLTYFNLLNVLTSSPEASFNSYPTP
jgi:hypothetical protein